ncbi:hypothetical protein LTR53_020207, partial [Teratosphaeriaceae sp. CCFEE 6253]
MAERQRLDAMDAQWRDRVGPSAGAPAPRANYPGSAPESLKKRTSKRRTEDHARPSRTMTPPSSAEEEESVDSDLPSTPTEQQIWDARVKALLKNLPKG